jgi:hypothetical protein
MSKLIKPPELTEIKIDRAQIDKLRDLKNEDKFRYQPKQDPEVLLKSY